MFENYEEPMNTQQAMEALKVSRMSIVRWTKQGILKCYVVNSRGDRRFFKKDLIEFMEKDK